MREVKHWHKEREYRQDKYVDGVLCDPCHYLFWCFDTVTLNVSSKLNKVSLKCITILWLSFRLHALVFLYEYAIKKHFIHHTGLKSFPNTCGFQLVFHSVSLFIYLARMRRSGWATTSWIFQNEFGNCCLSLLINSVRSSANRVLHFALICFRLFTRLLVIFDCFCIAACSPGAFDKSCLPAKFSFHISHSLAFAFVPMGFFDSHRSHVAKQRQLNSWYNFMSIAFLQVPFRYSLPFQLRN